MRRSPVHLAWTVLLTAFAIFCILAVAIPLGVRWYLANATRAHEAQVTCLSGTAVVEDPRRGGAVPVLQNESIMVPEGTVISVDDTAEAEITFFDQSLVRLSPSSSVFLEQMRSPQFGFSARPEQIILQVKGGRLWASTVLRSSLPIVFRMDTLQASTLLAEDGSYTFEVTNERTDVIVHRGEAEVSTASSDDPVEPAKVTLGSRQRTSVEIGGAPLSPMKAERDLLVNGDFGAALDTGWVPFNDQGADGGEVDGTVTLVEDEGRRAARLYRRLGQYNHCETILEQELNHDLPDPLTTLRVQATIKIANQSLSGGGYLSSEYPLMLKIRYRDVYGSETEWIHGFYYQNVDGNPTKDGQQIAQGRWYFYESENLVDTLQITPRRIVWLRVAASGWNYDSSVSEVNLIVE
jgi:hypothetical protein